MTLTCAATAYQKLLESIPTSSFPIEASPMILSSIEERISTLRHYISSLEHPRDRMRCSCDPLEAPYNKLIEFTVQYLNSQSPLSKEKILENLETAIPFITSSLKITPSTYHERLKLNPADIQKRMIHLPLKTVDIFHAHACGHRMKKQTLLGNGQYGAVFQTMLSRANSDELFACKEQTPPEMLHKTTNSATQEFFSIKESCAYSLLDHPNILQLLAFIDNPHQLYLEYANNGTLEHLLSSQRELGNNFRIIPELLRYRLFSQIADGLSYLHDQGFTHCDIKPDNILINNDNAKIGDLGFVYYTKNNEDTELAAHYAAPESVKKELLSEKLDVWSFAVLVYVTFKTHIPYKKNSDERWSAYRSRLFIERYNRAAQLTVIFTETQSRQWSEYDSSEIFRKLITNCLHGDPKIRFSMNQARDYLTSKADAFKVLAQEKQDSLAC